MPVLSYTCETLQLLFEEIGLVLNKPSRRLLAWLMIAQFTKTQAHLFRLAEKLPLDETTDMARRQRVRRFLSNGRIQVVLFIPALLRLLRPLLLDVPEVILSMDRTEWRKRGQVVNSVECRLGPRRDNVSAVLGCPFSPRRHGSTAVARRPHPSARCVTKHLLA